MQVRVLFEDRFRVLATMNGLRCETESFLGGSDKACAGLVALLESVAEYGLDGVPSKWFHEASKHKRVLEFRKGNYRLFFFKGQGRDIAVCVNAVRKTSQKADGGAVERAASAKAAYESAVANGTLEVIREDE